MKFGNVKLQVPPIKIKKQAEGRDKHVILGVTGHGLVIKISNYSFIN